MKEIEDQKMYKVQWLRYLKERKEVAYCTQPELQDSEELKEFMAILLGMWFSSLFLPS